MKFAFHIWGDRVTEFVAYASAPKTLFYRPGDPVPATPPGDVCAYLEPGQKIPSWPPIGVQYTDNSDRVPDGVRYVAFYGDVRKIQRDRRIPVVCDIMDENFWYYWESLQSFGLFTFSVNSTLCDPLIFQRTIENLRERAKPVKYGVLA